MMIRTAGGPIGNPIDFNERKTPLFTRNTWIALGVVGAAHLAVGAALYYQKFELAEPRTTDQPPPIILEIWKRPVEPPPPVVNPEPKPQPPTTRVNPLPTTPTTPDTLPIASGPTVSEGPITISHAVPDPEPAAPPAPQPPTPPAVIRNPTWISQPTGAQMMGAYPDRAVQRNIEGSARLNCLVLPTGRVTDCNVTQETGNNGFGAAAQRLSRYFRMNPRTVNGAAEGSRVDIGIRFTLPE